MKARAARLFAVCLIAAAAMLPCIPAASAADLTNLRCEYRVDPLGIDVTKPRLSWIIADPKSEISNLKSLLSG
jgi:alpha-L-rhamnosidase